MKLYLANGTYVGTQAEAKAITKQFDQVEVPTDKEGLIKYLNGITAIGDETFAPDEYTTVVERQDPPMDAKPARPLQDLQEAFDAAPLQLQGELAVRAIDRMVAAQAPLVKSRSWKQPDPMVEVTVEDLEGPTEGLAAEDDELFG